MNQGTPALRRLAEKTGLFLLTPSYFHTNCLLVLLHAELEGTLVLRES